MGCTTARSITHTRWQHTAPKFLRWRPITFKAIIVLGLRPVAAVVAATRARNARRGIEAEVPQLAVPADGLRCHGQGRPHSSGNGPAPGFPDMVVPEASGLPQESGVIPVSLLLAPEARVLGIPQRGAAPGGRPRVVVEALVKALSVDPLLHTLFARAVGAAVAGAPLLADGDGLGPLRRRRRVAE